MSPLTILITISSMYAAIKVAQGQTLAPSLIWSITNPILSYHNFSIGETEQALLFMGFSLIAFYGVYNGYAKTIHNHLNLNPKAATVPGVFKE